MLALKLVEGFIKQGRNVSIAVAKSEGKLKSNFVNLGVEIISIEKSGIFDFRRKLNSKKRKLLLLPSYESLLIHLVLLFSTNVEKYYVFDRKITSFLLEKKLFGMMFYIGSMFFSYFSKGYIFSYESPLKEYKNIKGFSSSIDRTVIYHPVSSLFFEKNWVDSNQYEYDLLYAGRFSTEKGLMVLLGALVELKYKYNYEPIVGLLGEGPLDNEARNFIATNNLVNVHMLGYSSDVAEFMIKSKRLILPSISEGCSGVVKEAMVVGLPAIVTNVNTDGPQEMIGHGLYGDVADEPGNSLVLAETIRRSLRRESFDYEYQQSFKSKLSIEFACTRYYEFLESGK
ncbi:glycosyltransferase [Vibrio fortis]|uniref:glycosyltransferase n=1 Tax=Vibrio fortis TaxID=212667 RepID=UPI0038CD8D48